MTGTSASDIDWAAYVARYLTGVNSDSWSTQAVADATAAERRAQVRACAIPAVKTVTASTVDGSATIKLTDGTFSGYDLGAAISGTGIPDGATIVSLDGNCQATLSEAATADGTSITLTVDPDVADLAEALARRVTTNLANRNLPLGVQTQATEFGTTANRVGGYDREVERLEGPYRLLMGFA
jgi:hypothetical protein